MHELVIKSNSLELINSLTFWFEDGTAQEEFKKSHLWKILMKIRAEGTTVPDLSDYPGITWSEEEYGYTKHTIEIDDE